MNEMIHEGRTIRSFPERKKTAEIIESGYDSEDFGNNYWLEKNIRGTRRIDRDAAQIRDYIRALVSAKLLTSKPSVCDVGCGPGNMMVDLRKHGFTVSGCEFSEAARALGKKHFNIDIPFGDLRARLPFDDDSFDFAYCVGVMTMIPLKRVPNACEELTRIIKQGGLLHVLLHNPGQTGPRAGNEPHLTTMPHSEWNSMFVNCGLVDVTSSMKPSKFGIGVAGEFAKLYQAK